MTPDNKYTQMQKTHYEITADEMRTSGNHRHHDLNPDYWGVLLKDVKDNPDDWRGKRGFDFGCGQGRNVINLLLVAPFARVDGGDISARNITYAAQNVTAEVGTMEKTKFFVLNGVELNNVPSGYYDFLMSTIVLQHIPVYTIRFKLLEEFYRVLKPGGKLSFQMGWDKELKPVGQDHYVTRDYYEDYYDAPTTNGRSDVSVTHSDQLKKDLVKIGFTVTGYDVREPWSDEHDKWIYMRATK